MMSDCVYLRKGLSQNCADGFADERRLTTTLRISARENSSGRVRLFKVGGCYMMSDCVYLRKGLSQNCADRFADER